MKKTFVNVGGLVIFYTIIIVGVLLLNQRFSVLNDNIDSETNNYYIAMND